MTLGSKSKAPRYGIVGDGRVATHFAHYLDLLNLPYRKWSRKLAQRTKLSPVDAFSDCDVVLFLIKDAAIEPLIQSAEFRLIRETKKLIHFSGSLVSTLAEGMHPLMTFSHELYDQKTYERIPFVTEAGGTAFEDVFPGLTNPSYAIPREMKSYYHALCVMSGNFTTLLWAKFFHELDEHFGIPRKAAEPYLRKITEELQRDPDQALTGPFSRKDYGTMKRNLDALEHQSDSFKKIYMAFIETHTPEAGTKL